MNLRELLEETAAELTDAEVDLAPDALTWSRAGRAFAVLSADGTAAEFALDGAIAAAATRTPDTQPSGRGPGWVRFSPTLWNGHAEDRANAWFRSAYRGQRHEQR